MSYSEVDLKELVGPAVARILARRNIGGAAAHYVQRASEPSHDELMHGLVRDFDPEWARAFAETHKVLPNPRSGEPEAMTRVNGLTYGSLQEFGREGRNAVEASYEADLRLAARKVRRGRDNKPKVYKLEDFFNDPAVAIKFGLSEAELQIARRAAIIDPAVACRNLTMQLKTMGENCTIVPGKYANSVKASRVRLHEALRSSNVAKPTIDMLLMGDNAYCEGPKDRLGRIAWTVKGPEKVAPEVAAVARLTWIHGVHTIRALFEEDLFKCGVLLIEESGPMVGAVELHYGGGVPETPAVAGTDGALLSLEVRSAGGRVLPLMEGGRIVGTAVRLSDEHAYANWHVLNEPSEQRAITVAVPGSPVSDIGLLHEVAPDIWTIQHQPSVLDEGAWVMREADEGEQCTFVYSGPRGPEYTDCVSVVRKEGSSVVTTRPDQARKGMSGAALVAMSDGALLGVYRGASIDMCSCAVVSHARQPMTDVTSVGLVMADADSRADSAYDRMVSRGLYRVLRDSIAALSPVYVRGVHCGYGVKHGSSVYTTLDCDVRTLSDAEGRTIPFERAQNGRFKSDAQHHKPGLSHVRLPRLGERVFVMGNDDNGVYFSEVMSVFRMASDNQGFWLNKDPSQGSAESFVYAGALIVAESDGSVLGQFADVVIGDDGPISRCVGMAPRTTLATAKRESMLNSIVSGVMVELWDSDAVEGLVHRDESIVSRFSGIGQSAIQTAVMLEFGRTGVLADSAGEMSAAISVVADSSWLSSRAYDCGLHHVLRPASGTAGRPAERLADAFRAYIGMIATWHGTDEVLSVLRKLDWFKYDWALEVSRLSMPARSPVLPQFTFASRTSTPSPGPGR